MFRKSSVLSNISSCSVQHLSLIHNTIFLSSSSMPINLGYDDFNQLQGILMEELKYVLKDAGIFKPGHQKKIPGCYAECCSPRQCVVSHEETKMMNQPSLQKLLLD